MSGILALCWHRYLRRLEEEPLRTKALTAALLAGLADVIAQRLVSSRSALNWRRTLSIALYGLLWGGPSNHYWQQVLERIFPKRGDPLRAVKKVALDQLTYGPLNNILFMTYIAAVVEGRSWAATRAKVRADYPAVQIKGWRLWPAAQFLNQTFVPLEMRVLWTNGVALVWSTFLITRARTASRVPWSALPVAKTHKM